MKHDNSSTVYEYLIALVVLLERYTVSSVHCRARRNCQKITMLQSLNLPDTKYELYGVINHLGTTVNCGHYVSFVKRGVTWYKCDDATVHKIDDIPMLSDDAYILVYYNNITFFMARRHSFLCPSKDIGKGVPAQTMAFKYFSFIFFFLIGYLSKFLSHYAKSQKVWKVINIFIITFKQAFLIGFFIFLKIF